MKRDLGRPVRKQRHRAKFRTCAWADRIWSRLLRLTRGAGGVPWRDGRVWLVVRLYVRGFCEAAERGFRLKPRSDLPRFRTRRRHVGADLAAVGPVDRSLRTRFQRNPGLVRRLSSCLVRRHDRKWMPCSFLAAGGRLLLIESLGRLHHFLRIADLSCFSDLSCGRQLALLTEGRVRVEEVAVPWVGSSPATKCGEHKRYWGDAAGKHSRSRQTSRRYQPESRWRSYLREGEFCGRRSVCRGDRDVLRRGHFLSSRM